jgi:predicted metal-dependent phosphoesterase TrpH
MKKYDLHIHSKYSNDGELEVKDLLVKCGEEEVELVSVTDHNTVNGIREALTEGLHYDIHVIPGIEIDCVYKGTDLHLLGYNINWESTEFAGLENDFVRRVTEVFPVMIDKLSLLGMKVDFDEVMAMANGQLPCGELVAEFVLNDPRYAGNEKLRPYRQGGIRSDMPYINFYLDYFAQGKPAYVKTEYMDYRDAVSLIKRNNGIPVVAHPGLNLKGREEMAVELLDIGAEGLEVFNNYHTHEQSGYFASLAREKGLIITCGSDFHGKNKPLIKPGSYSTIPGYEAYLTASMKKLVGKK